MVKLSDVYKTTNKCPEYDSDITYSQNDIISYNGIFYVSLQDYNGGNQPDTSSSYWSEYGGGGGLTWTATTSNTTIESVSGYLCDTSSGAVTLTCPASPTVGDSFGVVAIDLTNTLTIDGNGNNVAGSSSLEIDIEDSGMTFVYSSKGWVVSSEINAGGVDTISDNPNDQTGTSYTLVAGDAGRTIWMNNASANTVTIPANSSVAFDTNTVIVVAQEGAGTTTIQGDTGVTLNGTSGGSEAISAQYNACQLTKRGTDTWVAFGGLT